MTDSLSAEMFALMVYVCDDYLALKSQDEFAEKRDRQAAAARFFGMASQLPMDLQMVLCNRAFGSAKALILTKNSEPAFLNLSKSFAEEAEEEKEKAAAADKAMAEAVLSQVSSEPLADQQQ